MELFEIQGLFFLSVVGEGGSADCAVARILEVPAVFSGVRSWAILLRRRKSEEEITSHRCG